MRRLLLLTVLLTTFVPAPAHAWFGFLDYLSGPGKWYGALYDVRVACFGQELAYAKEVQNLLSIATVQSSRAGVALQLAQAARGPNPDRPMDVPELAEAQKSWAAVRDKINDISDRYPVWSQSRRDRLKRVLRPLAEPRPSERTAAYLSLVELYQNSGGTPPAGGVVPSALYEVLAATEQLGKSTLVANGMGVFISLCPEGKKEVWGVDVNADFYQAKSDGVFADDYTIRLTSFAPTVSRRVVTNPRFDFADLRAGVGRYRFSSRGIPAPVSGWAVMPLQLDIHGPTAWNDEGGLKGFFALTTFRTGVTWFVGGFDPGVFNANEPTRNEKIGNELVPTYAVYVNLTPLFRKKLFR